MNRIYNIDENECLGDALSKINANFISLDTVACNLKSKTVDFDKTTTALQQNSAIIDLSFKYITNNSQNLERLYNTVNELTKYWLGSQFTIYAEPHYISDYAVNTAEIIRVSILNVDYKPTGYPEYTIANVIKTNFNRKQWPDSTITLPAVSAVHSVEELSHSIYRFMNYEGSWRYFETINCPINPEPEKFYDTTNAVLVLSTVKVSHTNQFKIIDIVAQLSTVAGFTNLPATDYFAWEWSIDGIKDAALPITAVPLTFSLTSPASLNGTVNSITSVSGIRLFVEPGIFTDTPIISTLYVAGYEYTDNSIRTNITTYEVGSIPDRSLFDVYFTISESNVIIGDSDTGTLTRDTSNKIYKLVGNIHTVPHTEEYEATWIVKQGSTTTTTPAGELTLNLNGAGLTTVTLCAHDAFSLAWGDYHAVSRTVTFIQTIFPSSPDFIIYPDRVWDPSPVYLNSSNYTISVAPTTYGHRYDQTAQFYVSATPGYTLYCWQVGDYIFETTNSIDLLNIPYSAGIYREDGSVVSLTAYNFSFPKTGNTIEYKTKLGTFVYPLTAKTSNTNTNKFKTNPKILPYDEVYFEYDLENFDIDYANNNKIVSVQNIFSKLNSPVRIIGGEVTYTLTNDIWSSTKTVSATNSTNTIFCLTPGDASILEHSEIYTISDLRLSACATLISQINDPSAASSEWAPISSVVCFSPVRPEFRITPSITPTGTMTPTPTPTVTPTLTQTPTLTPTTTPVFVDICGVNIRRNYVGRFTYTITVNNGTGIGILRYNTFNIPDRFTVIFDGAVVADTGWVGDTSYNSDLALLGFGPVTGPGRGTITFNKNTGTNFVQVVVEAPLPGTVWEFEVDCLPVVTMTPTITPTNTPTNTTTNTPTRTSTITPTPTPTRTIPPTPSITPTITPTPTLTPAGRVLMCGDTVTETGTGVYTYRILTGSLTGGSVNIEYNTFNIPDRFTLVHGTTSNTGFVGDSSYDEALAILGYPAVTGPSTGTITYSIIPGLDTILIAEAPITGTQFTFKVEC